MREDEIRLGDAEAPDRFLKAFAVALHGVPDFGRPKLPGIEAGGTHVQQLGSSRIVARQLVGFDRPATVPNPRSRFEVDGIEERTVSGPDRHPATELARTRLSQRIGQSACRPAQAVQTPRRRVHGARLNEQYIVHGSQLAGNRECRRPGADDHDIRRPI